MKRAFIVFALLSMGTLVIGGCGGDSNSSDAASDSSSDDSAVVGLVLPENMSIVTAQDDSSSVTMLARAFTDSGTDYSSDTVNTYVYDRSMESLGIVNMILCLMDQTAASDMVNQGDYIALVNEDECEQGQNNSSAGSTGQASGGQATQFNSWTINSSRADNDSPQIVHLWVPGETPDSNDPEAALDAQTIVIELTLNEGASDTNPFGSFVMNFKGVVDGGLIGGTAGEEVETMHGVLETVDNSSDLQFRFYNQGGDMNDASLNLGFGFQEAVNVIMDDADGTGGTAHTSNTDVYTPPGGPAQQEESSFAIAFDTAHLFRGLDNNGDDVVDAQRCLSRSDFDTQVWRYNLYHRDTGTFNNQSVNEGERVALNSGFPFSYDSDNDSTTDSYGWAGYNGIWSEAGDIPDGATIVQFDYDSDTTINHTVNVSNGRVIRRSANQEPLSSFQGDEFMYWGPHPGLNGMWGQWLVTVDTNNDLQITGTFEWGENGMERSTTIDDDNDPQTPEVSVVGQLTLNDRENVWLWSDALGGNVSYVHDISLAPSAREVTFYGEEFVFPGDSDLFSNGTSITLYCYERCLRGGLTQNDIDNATSDMDLYYTYSGTPLQYTLSSSNGKLTLTDDSNSQEVSAVGLDMSALGYDWGINTGEMLTSPLVNAAEPWLVYQQAITYKFETGPNDWNRLITVSDGNGGVETFDKPLRFVYTHSTANDANGDATYDGKKFMLEYGGPGELWGFPWVEDSENNRWHSAVTLANGVVLSDGTNSFVVKGIEREQTMQAVSDSDCSSLDISSVFSDSNLALPTSSNLNSISLTLADKPDVTDAPAVIEGEVQD